MCLDLEHFDVETIRSHRSYETKEARSLATLAEIVWAMTFFKFITIDTAKDNLKEYMCMYVGVMRD